MKCFKTGGFRVARMVAYSISAVLLVVASQTSAVAEGGTSCSELAYLSLEDTTITAAETVSDGSFTPPGTDIPITNLPEFCRVTGSIKPTAESDIRFEVWLPTQGWNKKFLSSGEGGWAGYLDYPGMGASIQRGYAGGSTDTGHQGNPFSADFAVGQPEKLIDFGYRAKHLQAVKSKEIIRAYYGEEIQHSYFASCSNGGRQGMMLSQRYPNDYDGLIIGAPAFNWTRLFTSFVWNHQALNSDPASQLTLGNLSAIQTATLNQCDANDGVVDGVVDEPRRCNFNPETIQCPSGTQNDSCLTLPQVEAVKKITQGARFTEGGWLLKGRRIYPGFFTSRAADFANWPGWVTGSPATGPAFQTIMGSAHFGRVVEGIPAPGVWDPNSLTFGKNLLENERNFAGILNATDKNLLPFLKANPRGKIIFWHGWEDAAISAQATVNYFKGMQRRTPWARKFTRLFMVPGMAHCFGGPGPNSFGQNLLPISDSPDHDILSALERWVEQGVAPNKIIATKYVDDNPANGVEKTKPLCAYPKVAIYSGTGSTDEAENYICGYRWER